MVNRAMMQSFEWELPNEGNFYTKLEQLGPELVKRGFDAVWLPPVCKATSNYDVGYGIYDLFDLGEFDQKGSVRTKYGTKEELQRAIRSLQEAGLLVYMDVVLNHKAGADYTEVFQAVPVDPNNRGQEIGPARDIEAWTGFNFPGRQDQYSNFHWFFQHFTGVDYDQRSGETGVFRIIGDQKGWAYGVSQEFGNFDYLMFADIDHSNLDVRKELFYWQKWFVETTGCNGFRMDAVKHIDDSFMSEFSKILKEQQGDGFYLFGEYWNADLHNNGKYLYELKYSMDIFDVGLHFHFYEASQNENYDLRQLFDNTVVQEFPMNAVTFVDNHDTQPGQALESFVGRHFKERAYACILLRKDGYPCVFAGDYFGIKAGSFPQEDLQYDIERLLELRTNYAYGEQWDFFQSADTIGWARMGNEEHPAMMATVISMKDETEVWMDFGPENQGRTFRDYLHRFDHEICLDENGKAAFPVRAASVSCWVNQLSEEHMDNDTTLLVGDQRDQREKLYLY